MNLKEYAFHINEILRLHPEAAEFKIIATTDSNGGYYDYINTAPTVCAYSESSSCILDSTNAPNAVYLN